MRGSICYSKYFLTAADVRGLKLLHVFEPIMTIIFSSFIIRTEIHRSSYICSRLRSYLPPQPGKAQTLPHSSSHPDKPCRNQPGNRFWGKKKKPNKTQKTPKLWEGSPRLNAQVKSKEAVASPYGRTLKIAWFCSRLFVFHKSEQSRSVHFAQFSCRFPQDLRTTTRNGL